MVSFMTYSQAKAAAFKRNPSYNACREYKDGYHFYKKTDAEVDGDSGVVVLKADERVINFVTFLLDFHPERDPEERLF